MMNVLGLKHKEQLQLVPYLLHPHLPLLLLLLLLLRIHLLPPVLLIHMKYGAKFV
jgi:hypothetical protein